MAEFHFQAFKMNTYIEQPVSSPEVSPPLNSFQRRVGITVPNANDILCGRGKTINAHTGNIQFLSIIKNMKGNYNAAELNKKIYGKLVVQAIQSLNPPGRFLQKDKEDDLWYDIGEQKALLKTRVALREGVPALRKLGKDLKCPSKHEKRRHQKHQHHQQEEQEEQGEQGEQEDQRRQHDNGDSHPQQDKHQEQGRQHGQDFDERYYCDRAFAQEIFLQGPPLLDTHDFNVCMLYHGHQPCSVGGDLDNHDLEKILEPDDRSCESFDNNALEQILRTDEKVRQSIDNSRCSFSCFSSQKEKMISVSSPLA